MNRPAEGLARAACLVCLALPSLASVPAHALELGFEGYAALIASDNIEADDSGEEEDGLIGVGLVGVYGERRGPRVRGAFTGELDARRRLDDDDGESGTVSRFLGAAEVALTPRALRWYIGDILGGVRTDDAIQPISDHADAVARRNVFVTGPSLEYDIGGSSRVRSRLLYVNQREDDEELETLWNAQLGWERDAGLGARVGLLLADVYTDSVDEEESGPDFNRFSASAYGSRERGFLLLYGELGATRYDADEESLDGLRAELSATRALGPASSVVARLSRDLSDQSLSTVESLIEDGSGEEPEADGFFDETRLELGYLLDTERSSLDIGAGIARRDFRLLAGGDGRLVDGDGEDQVQGFAYAALSQRLAARWRAELGASYERQSHDEREDERDSFLGSLRLLYRLGRSFELEAGYLFDRASGSRTRARDGAAVLEDIDVTENRLTLGLRWAPPSRASRDLTVELKSLLR